MTERRSVVLPRALTPSEVLGYVAPPLAMRSVFFLIPGLLLLACRSDAKAVNNAEFTPERVADLFFTTGLGGYVEPCGCTADQLGGIARLATVVARSEVAHGLVDAGQLLLPTEALDDFTRPQHRAKAHLLARAFRSLGVVASNVAPTDLAEGPDFLAELQKEGAVPFVSANVRPRSEKGPEVARAYVRIIGGIRVGITGAAIPEQVAEVSEAFAPLEIVPAVRNEVETLRRDGAEVVVMLAHVSNADARALAEAVPDIDVLIRAPGTPIERPPSAPFRVGPVVVAEAGQQGQYVGRIRIGLSAGRPPRPLQLDDAGARAAAARARLERKIAALDKEIARFQLLPGKAEVATARQQLKAQLQARLQRPPPPRVVPRGPFLEVTITPLVTELPEQDEVKAMMAAYDQTLRKMNYSRGDPAACELAEGQPHFVGTQACATCHQAAMKVYAGTSHAQAWSTLEERGKDFDLTCVGCHSVGFRSPGGYCALGDVDRFRNVGCESCHGPGSAHIAAPSKTNIDRAERETNCTRSCHVPEHSDGFVYETYVRKILGPGHGADAEAPR